MDTNREPPVILRRARNIDRSSQGSEPDGIVIDRERRVNVRHKAAGAVSIHSTSPLQSLHPSRCNPQTQQDVSSSTHLSPRSHTFLPSPRVAPRMEPTHAVSFSGTLPRLKLAADIV